MDFVALRRALQHSDERELHALLDRAGLDMVMEAGHGRAPAWREQLQALPPLEGGTLSLDQAVVTASGVAAEPERLREALFSLSPYRKGPFQIGDVLIDSEWRSQLKFERVAACVSFAGKAVLDVGAGNGYYALRALGRGARCVLGVDPMVLSVVQFEAFKHYAGQLPAWLLPLRDEDLPDDFGCFDVVMSMGVLYHQPAPFTHLRKLRAALRPGGQLVLETLVTEGGEHHAFVPQERYAGMRNVYLLPSPAALCRWLLRAGFAAPKVWDVTRTTGEEQRRTEWSRGESLADFLSSDGAATREGHPPPTRAIVTAVKS